MRFLDGVAEIRAGRNAAGVEEDLAVAEPAAQMVTDAPGDVLRIRAAI